MNRQRYTEEDSIRREVLNLAEQLCNSREQAHAWCQQESLQAFDGKTPMQLIAGGRGQDLSRYLRSLHAGALG